MKPIQGILLLSIVPFLTPLTAFAEPEKQTARVSPDLGTKGSAASWRASQVIGLNLKNADDETVGDVEDLVLDMKTGKVLAVIISSGGFLGIADSLSAVPVTALRYDGTAKGFKTKLTKEQLGRAPQFKADAWPDYNDAASMEALRSFRDSVGGDETAPDNTRQNKKETNRDAVTPIDQGQGKQDVQITKDIRSGVMDTDMSFNAKNIKIITREGSVTLKGVVNSDAEHQAVLEIARNHADTAKITDELKVKSK